MRILLTGANGQLGTEIRKSVPKNIDLIAMTKKEFNLANAKNCKKQIMLYKPDWIINAAAYTKVDLAEKEENLSLAINGYGPEIIAETIKNTNTKIIQISTDYVFDGNSKTPYKTNDKTNPINAYGRSKEFGEAAIEKVLKITHQGLILRTSWLMSHVGENFITTMLKLHASKQKIKVINDQFGSLTTTYSLTKACFKIINKFSNQDLNLPLKLHWCNTGIANWAQIAKRIGDIGFSKGLLKNKAEIIPIKTRDFKQNAKRPLYSVLDCLESQKIIEYVPSNWDVALNEIIEKFKSH